MITLRSPLTLRKCLQIASLANSLQLLDLQEKSIIFSVNPFSRSPRCIFFFALIHQPRPIRAQLVNRLKETLFQRTSFPIINKLDTLCIFIQVCCLQYHYQSQPLIYMLTKCHFWKRKKNHLTCFGQVLYIFSFKCIGKSVFPGKNVRYQSIRNRTTIW